MCHIMIKDPWHILSRTIDLNAVEFQSSVPVNFDRVIPIIAIEFKHHSPGQGWVHRAGRRQKRTFVDEFAGGSQGLFGRCGTFSIMPACAHIFKIGQVCFDFIEIMFQRKICQFDIKSFQNSSMVSIIQFRFNLKRNNFSNVAIKFVVYSIFSNVNRPVPETFHVNIDASISMYATQYPKTFIHNRAIFSDIFNHGFSRISIKVNDVSAGVLRSGKFNAFAVP